MACLRNRCLLYNCDKIDIDFRSLSSHRTTPLASMGYGGGGVGSQSGSVLPTTGEMNEEHDLHLVYDQT